MKILKKIIILSTLTVTLLSLNNGSLLNAQISNPEISPIQFNKPKLPPRGTPGGRRGGGSRSLRSFCLDPENNDCNVVFESEDDQLICPNLSINPVVALVPQETENNLTYAGGLTANPSPTFWFYLPYSADLIQKGEFEIWDKTNPNPQQHQRIYTANFTPVNIPGIVSLTIPSNLRLQPGKFYEWKLDIISSCEQDTIEIHGQIQVVENPPILDNLTPRDQALEYAKAGIWYDSLTILGQLILKDPHNSTLLNDWQKLLKDVELENLEQQPVVPCCQLDPKLAQ